MPPNLTLANYCALVAKSKLLPAETVRDQFTNWQGRHPGEDLESFRKYLVKNDLLTEYQAVMLARGHADGFQLDQYTILDRIGKGRMAGVFRARHATGQEVAIKVLPPSSAKEGQLLARFRREAGLLTKLEHPNVVRAFQFGEAGGKHYFVMECLEGETLDEALAKRKRLTIEEAVHIAHETLLGLEHLREKGMIHRDVKPANLMLLPNTKAPDDLGEATVKILDIGLGKAFFEEGSIEQPTASDLTSQGVLLGTPDYLAPEQAKNAAGADIRADIYSVGCVLYHCLTGQPPFPDRNLMNQVVRHATEDARPLTSFLVGVPDGLQTVVDNLIAKDPSKRYQTPGKAAEALQLFLHHLPDASPARKASPKYIQWLESSGYKEPTADLPVAKVRGSGGRPMPRLEARTKDTAPAVQPQPIVEPIPVDVELVPLDEKKRGPLEFDRRDAIMLLVGAVGALAAAGAAYWASRK